MGAVHDGHLALVRASRAAASFVVASLFVNPRQFGESEDLAAYPRDEAGDGAKLAAAGCDLLYAPTEEQMYPAGFATAVSVARLGQLLEGRLRPGHFDGVATVVAKLLIQAAPDVAAFGEKDYQQLVVVRRLARDLDLGVEILAVPTVRAADGLALSSRNAYLSADERALAPALHRTLAAMAERLASGRVRAADEIERGTAALREAGFRKVDYIAVCDAESLEPAEVVRRSARVLAAAWLGRTRLIDNVAVVPRD
jgi:pantoate--beta-alanine ligase